MNQAEFSTVCHPLSDFFENSNRMNNSLKDSKIAGLFKIYNSMNHQFKLIGRPELTERMLRRIMMSESISRDFQIKPLYVNLSGIIDELMMSEIEIALWAIYLENIVWKKFDTFSEQVLLFSAYKAKLYLNGNSIKPIKVYLMAKIDGFQKNFKQWHQQYEDKFDIELKEINSKFNYLKKFKGAEIDYGTLSYNYYVDVILLSAIPYAERKGKEILKIKEDSSEDNDKTHKNSKLIKKAKKENPIKHPQEPRKIIKIEKSDKAVAFNNTIREEKHDPEIEKIERFCDGLLQNDDLNPDDFLNSFK
ncbi:unnamed protein product [Blepharisma stoltei]|uniref:Uncharacterized protein n=1 Tax=Blepharisma stoltei TaxID=1481888 RepID=A0AAU9IX41_9CILI|nr:unnamed protein product [Blepharisma stoltei]